MSSAKRIIVASTRLPVTLSPEGSTWRVHASPGGLATALRNVASESDFVWVGWPGADVPLDAREQVTQDLRSGNASIPIFLEPDEREGFYEEFSNRLLWPLFHNLSEHLKRDRKAWEHYRAVNQRFADAIAWQAREGDTIWVHDYQLMLVPQMLRDKGVGCPVGFFLHIPFPSSETYRTLPHREEILRGILGADLIGFHAYEYISQFRNACLRVLGVESDPENLWTGGERCRLAVLPVGIDPVEIRELASSREIQQELAELRRNYASRKIIIGVDRLDYTKGLPEKLMAFGAMLDRHPHLRDQVVLIPVASPSRTEVREYQELKREIDGLVGNINGRYGSVNGIGPVVYINQHLSRKKLTALYQLADVAMVTPLRDGMNLVALEYIAARGDQPGTLILSEFAGAAACLPGAHVVNPHDVESMSEVLAQVVAEPKPSATAFAHMREFVDRNTASVWAEAFLSRLAHARTERREEATPLSTTHGKAAALLTRAQRPLVLLDYDGTLREHVQMAGNAHPEPELISLLTVLCELARVYVVSGRSAQVLDAWLGGVKGMGLVCEHGWSLKHVGLGWSTPPAVDQSVLREQIVPVLEDFVARTPGSKIESKVGSIAWHYRAADHKLGSWRAKELHHLLNRQLQNMPYNAVRGSRVIEVRPGGVSKGNAVLTLVEKFPDADVVLCAGNDRTDEEMFEALERSGVSGVVTCHIGAQQTAAAHRLDRPEAFRRVLAQWVTRLREAGARPPSPRAV
ncbi:MAG: bifunctional alpha,alpha-trehalose-phosphate synthase (UDP-forming)/trehalose-phosphatase [Nannocystaceae bacterium]